MKIRTKSSLRPSSARKRDRILKVAARLFLAKGFQGVSMAELLRRVGGSKSTIYTHFGSKAALFEATVDELLADIRLRARAEQLEHVPVRDALLEIARLHLRVVLSKDYIQFVRFVASEMKQVPQLARIFYAHGPKGSYDFFAKLLQLHIARGEIIDCDVELATDAFFGILLHRRVLERLYGVESGPPPRLEQTATRIVDTFLRWYERRD